MQWLDLTLDLFFPDTCPACGGIPARTLPLALCGRCIPELWSLPRAMPRGPGQRTAVALGDYEGPLGRALLHAKSGGRRRALHGLGCWAAEQLAGRVPSVDAIVPVPSSMAHGLDPVLVLSRPVGTRLGVPVVPLVERVSSMGQHGRTAGARRALAHQSYRVPVLDHVRPPQRVLLFDDVRTTGATLDACTQELLGAGVRRVHVVTLTVASGERRRGLGPLTGLPSEP